MSKTKIQNGLIERLNDEGALHSDYWVPTRIYADGAIMYYYNGCCYANYASTGRFFYHYSFISDELFHQKFYPSSRMTCKADCHRQLVTSLENPNKIKIEKI